MCQLGVRVSEWVGFEVNCLRTIKVQCVQGGLMVEWTVCVYLVVF